MTAAVITLASRTPRDREVEAREECERRGIDPDEICADGGVEAWMVVAKEFAEPCPKCGSNAPIMQGGVWGFFPHDHKPDQSGLDDGPPLPGHAPRKKPAPKSAEEISEIRSRAWATRRATYGKYGHR